MDYAKKVDRIKNTVTPRTVVRVLQLKDIFNQTIIHSSIEAR